MFKEKTSNAKASLCLKLLMVLLCSAAFVLSSFGFCGGTAYAETAYTLIDEMNETGYLDDNSIVSSASEDQALNGLRFENVYEPFYATSETITGFAFKLNISGVTQGSLIFTLNTSTENTSAEPARIPSAAAATVIIPYEEISANYNTGKVWVRVAFNTPVTVTPGALYYLGVNADGFNAEATVQNLGQVTSHAGGQNADKIPHVLIQQAKDSTEFVMSPGAGCGFFKIYTKDKNGVTIIDSVTEANYIDDNTIIHSGTTDQALNGLRFENIYQPFTATSGTVTGIAVSLEISGVTQGTLKIGIVEDYLNPAGTEVAGVRIPYNRISAYLTGGWVRVAFNTPATVTAGEQYYIYINCDGFNDTASAVNKGEPAGIGSDTKNRDAISGALQIEKKDDLTLSSTGTYTYFKVYTKDGSGAVIETIAQQDYMNTEVIAAHGNRGGVASGQGFDSATAVVGSKSVKSSFSGEGKDKVIFYREIMADGGLINTNYISKDNLMFSFWIKNTGADNILLKAGSAVLLGEEDSNPDGSYTEGQTKFALNTDYTLLPGWNKVNVDVSAALAGTSEDYTSSVAKGTGCNFAKLRKVVFDFVSDALSSDVYYDGLYFWDGAKAAEVKDIVYSELALKNAANESSLNEVYLGADVALTGEFNINRSFKINTNGFALNGADSYIIVESDGIDVYVDNTKYEHRENVNAVTISSSVNLNRPLSKDQTVTLTVNPVPSSADISGYAVSWTISSEAFTKVSQDGLTAVFKAVSGGTAEITASVTPDGGTPLTASVTVECAVSSVLQETFFKADYVGADGGAILIDGGDGAVETAGDRILTGNTSFKVNLSATQVAMEFYRECFTIGYLDTTEISRTNLKFGVWMYNGAETDVVLKAGSSFAFGERDSNANSGFSEWYPNRTNFSFVNDKALAPGWNLVVLDISAAVYGESSDLTAAATHGDGCHMSIRRLDMYLTSDTDAVIYIDEMFFFDGDREDELYYNAGTEEALLTYIEAGYKNIKTTGAITLTKTLEVTSDLDLDASAGKIIINSAAPVISVKNGAELNLKCSGLEGGTVQIYVENGTANVSGNITSAKYTAAVFEVKPEGTLNFTGSIKKGVANEAANYASYGLTFPDDALVNGKYTVVAITAAGKTVSEAISGAYSKFTSNGYDVYYVAVVKVESVTINTPAKTELTAGEAVQLSATVNPSNADNKTITWSSSDTTGKVSVSAAGLLSVAADAEAGEYTITVTTADGAKTDSIVITVKAAETDDGGNGGNGGDTGKDTPKSNTGLIIGIVAGVVVIAGAAAAFIIIKKKKAN